MLMMSAGPGESIRCPKCGVPNTIAAYACARCGASLLGTDPIGPRMPKPARPARPDSIEPGRIPIPWKKIALVAGVVVTFLLGGWVGLSWAVENRYPFGEPKYDSRPASYWVVELQNDDVYLRRRAALALVTLSTDLNRPDAETTIPWLERALSDHDEKLRVPVQAALGYLARQHPGVSGRRQTEP